MNNYIFTLSDIIQLIGIIASFFTSIVAIMISFKTLRQNSKMIEETSRPYISIYFDYTQMGEPTGYFVVKNFGSTTAIIDSLTYNEPIANHPVSLSNLASIFNGLVGNSIAPNQKFLVPFKLNEYIGGDAIFEISYHAKKKKYSERFIIYVSNYKKLVKPRFASNNYKSLSYPLQEISERLM